jgi:hypothetical protein
MCPFFSYLQKPAVMRTARFFLFLFSVFLRPLYPAAQTLPAFPDQTAEWYQVYVQDPASSPPGSFSFLQCLSYPSPAGDSLMDLYVGNELIGYIRSDQNRVWFQRADQGSVTGSAIVFEPGDWYLLYDFSLQPGDTAYFDYYSNSQAVVDSVAVTNLTGLPVRWLYLSNDDVIIEKTGSIEGLFRPYMHLFESASQLCSFTGFFEGSGSFAVSWDTSAGWCQGGINGMNSELFAGGTISPNPVSDQLLIRTPEGPVSYTIFTATGENLFTFGPSQTAETMISVGSLAPGTYYLQTTGVSGIRTVEKFLKR